MSATVHAFDPGPAVRTPRGPKGCRLGDVVRAEGSRWRVEAIDGDRREAVCRLLGSAGAFRRFRARRIEAVERSPRRREAAAERSAQQELAL